MDIYYYRNKKHDWGQEEENLLRHVSSERRKKIACMYRDSDKELSLYVELICRYAVSRIINCRPDRIEISKTAFGKPYIVSEGLYPIEITLSHSGEYAVCAVSSENVGIDVEEMKTPPMEVADIAFGLAEKEYLNNAADRSEAFYTVWTRKEALLKKMGCGLVDEITQMNVVEFNGIDTFHSVKMSNHMITVCSMEKAEPHFHEVMPSILREFYES